jgi:hypothetical protein
MRPLVAIILMIIATSLVLVTAATACVKPFVRAGYGGQQLVMREHDDLIGAFEHGIPGIGKVPDVGPGYGPEVAAGLWLAPNLRVGAAYSFQRAVRQQRVAYAWDEIWTHRSDFRIATIGGEAAARFPRLAGFIVGIEAGAARGELIERVEDVAGVTTGWRRTAHRVRPMIGGYVGLDQTNEQGLAGFVRAGWRHRDFDAVHSGVTRYALGEVTSGPGPDLDLDFSGFYVTVGVGFDGGR